MAFLMAGAVHLLYRLLFGEVNSFLAAKIPEYLAGPATGSLLLLLIIPIYRILLSDSRPFSRSFRPEPRALLWGFLVGLLAGFLVLLIALFWSPASESALPPVGGLLAIMIWTPIVEELYYRFMIQGYLMGSMVEHGHSRQAAKIIPLAFATVCFLFSHDYFIAPVLLIPSLAFGLIFIQWNVTAAMISHAVYNAVLIGGTYVSQNHG